MTTVRQVVVLTVALTLLTLTFPANATRPVTIDLDLLRTWDSNLTRTKDAVSDQLTHTGAGIQAEASIGRQTFLANWRLERVEHMRHVWRDATLRQGQFGWNGQFGRQLAAELGWQRYSYLVDLADFNGRDIVDHQRTHVSTSYFFTPAVATNLILDERRETHSSNDRQFLDHKDHSLAAELRYESNRASSLELRTAFGKRDYTTMPDFDFDYKEVELRAEWTITEKTRVGGSVGRLWREGGVDQQSNVGAIALDWQATEKTLLRLAYGSRQPAPEASHAQSVRERYLTLTSSWRLSEKLSIGSEATRWQQDYAPATAPGRSDTTYALVPMLVTYQPQHWAQLALQTGWQHRTSTLPGLDYHAAQITLNASITF